jgi:hypothetical protein
VAIPQPKSIKSRLNLLVVVVVAAAAADADDGYEFKQQVLLLLLDRVTIMPAVVGAAEARIQLVCGAAVAPNAWTSQCRPGLLLFFYSFSMPMI